MGRYLTKPSFRKATLSELPITTLREIMESFFVHRDKANIRNQGRQQLLWSSLALLHFLIQIHGEVFFIKVHG